jgi:hypothetical protein
MRAFSLFLAALFASVPASPAAAQDVERATPPSVADMRVIVERMRAEMYAPGERVANWDRGGADPDAALRAAGADSHFYRLHRAHGEAVVMLTDRPIASFVPAGWRVVDTYGASATRVANPFVQFEAFSDRYVIAIRAGSARRGDADCVDAVANATLYERPGAAAIAADDNIPLFFRLVLLAGEGQTVCTRYEGSARAGWRGRAFLPDGRRLPQLDDAEERITIVPRAPIEGLITYRAPARAS